MTTDKLFGSSGLDRKLRQNGESGGSYRPSADTQTPALFFAWLTMTKNSKDVRGFMSKVVQVALRLMPVGLPLGGWKLAVLINAGLGCSAIGKSAESCIVGGVDVMPLLSPVAWWGMLLWVPGLLISGVLLGQFVAKQLPPPWGDRAQDCEQPE